jgi:hypothetical protein
MAYVVHFGHHLEIDGVPLSTPAWEHVNIEALYAGPTVRGENRVMPGAGGRRALLWRPDETMVTVSLAIFGDVRWDGTVNTDAVAGLWANRDHLYTNVVANPGNTDSTRAGVIKRAGAADRTARIQVRGFNIEEHIGTTALRASLDIAVISGSFV